MMGLIASLLIKKARHFEERSKGPNAEEEDYGDSDSSEMSSSDENESENTEDEEPPALVEPPK